MRAAGLQVIGNVGYSVQLAAAREAEAGEGNAEKCKRFAVLAVDDASPFATPAHGAREQQQSRNGKPSRARLGNAHGLRNKKLCADEILALKHLAGCNESRAATNRDPAAGYRSICCTISPP